MKTPSIVLKALLLSCILFISTRGIASGKINGMKGKASKKKASTLKKLQPAVSFLSAIERQFNVIEKNIVATAQAMPEDKFYFTPESLNIKGSELKGVRRFAGQIKHLATDNFAIWSPVTGDPLRADITDVNGPENIKTKAAIMQYLKESFALGRKAIATLTEQNAMDMLDFRGSKLARLDLAFYALTHSNEHYGQMVVYLRMCSIIPPASMPVKQ